MRYFTFFCTKSLNPVCISHISQLSTDQLCFKCAQWSLYYAGLNTLFPTSLVYTMSSLNEWSTTLTPYTLQWLLITLHTAIIHLFIYLFIQQTLFHLPSIIHEISLNWLFCPKFQLWPLLPSLPHHHSNSTSSHGVKNLI